jgi:hypothetical protein
VWSIRPEFRVSWILFSALRTTGRRDEARQVSFFMRGKFTMEGLDQFWLFAGTPSRGAATLSTHVLGDD